MFVLATLRDNLRLEPELFGRDINEVLTEVVDRKYANRVLLEVGLCICLYDFEDIGEAFILPSDGSANYKVRFRLVVFRPFVGEILVGKVLSCNPDGVRVSLGFFEDVHIPSYLLQAPSVYDEKEKLWLWKYDDEAGEEGEEGEGKGGGEGGAEAKKVDKKVETVSASGWVGGGEEDGAKADDEGASTFHISLNETIRFRVRTLNFTQVTATEKGLQATTVSTGQAETQSHKSPALLAVSGGVQAPGGGGGSSAPLEGLDRPPMRKRSTSVDLTSVEEAPSAMTIRGGINEEGLGLVCWWEDSSGGDDDEEEEGAEEGEGQGQAASAMEDG